MEKEYNFQKELKKSIFESDPNKIDKHDLLKQIFKAYVAKLFEYNLSKKREDRLEFGVLVEVKRNLISEFRKTDLGEYQKSTGWYEYIFDKTIKEIFEEAAKNHQGADSVNIQQTLEINPKSYINESGLFVPEHLKKIG